MPHHQQLRTLANLSSKPYIETRVQKKELLQTRDTYGKFSFSPSENKKRGKRQQQLTQQQLTKFSPRHLQVRTFENFLQKLPKYASFLRHKYKKNWQKRTYSESSKRRTLGLRSKNPCAIHPPRRTLALSHSLRATIPVSTRAQKTGRNPNDDIERSFKDSQFSNTSSKSLITRLFLFLFFWYFLFCGDFSFFFPLNFFGKGGAFLARKYMIKYL
jgi:hypothetical protein